MVRNLFPRLIFLFLIKKLTGIIGLTQITPRMKKTNRYRIMTSSPVLSWVVP